MRYHFIALVIVMSNAIKGAPPLLAAASGLNARSASMQAERISLEKDPTHTEPTPTATYPLWHQQSPWPTCREMIECLQGCCYAAYILARLSFEDAQREPIRNNRENYYQGFHERTDR